MWLRLPLHGSGQDLAPYQEVLERMLATLVHRGPDGEGLTHVDKQALFGHRRLAVIDLVQGAQPMRSACGR